MKMRMGVLSVAVAACMATLTAGTAKAATAAPAMDHEIRVINRYATTVRVYVQDADGGLYMLGRVAASDFKVLKVPAKIAGMGKVRIKVFPVAPFEALTMGVDGVQSRGIALDGRDAVNFYVESDLLRSVLEIVNG